MNWIAIEAVGSVLAAFATTGAVLVALYQSGVIFQERLSIFLGINYKMTEDPTNVTYMQISATNKGMRNIYVQMIGFTWAKQNKESYIIPKPKYGEYNIPIESGKSSKFYTDRKALIDAAKEDSKKYNRKGESKLKIIISTEIKSYYKTTKYTLNDILALDK